MSALPEQAVRTKRERCTADVRRRAILDAARDVFLERGYAGASVDAVVERAGGSKATVYAMFGNKEGLLTALVADGAERLAEAVDHLPLDMPLEESLRNFGIRFLELIVDPVRLALYRLVVGESGRFPELGDAFFRTGPAAINDRIAVYFRSLAERGLLPTTDPDHLASYFLGAMRADLHFRALFNPTLMPSREQIERHVDFVVSEFLHGVLGRS